MKDIKSLGDQLVNLTVKEVQELATYLKETYGVEQAGGVSVVTKYVAPGDGDYSPAQTMFEVVLKSAGVNKLQVVKLVKDITGLGLKDAKDLVDGAPRTIKVQLPESEAESIKNQLLNIGADVEVK